MKIEEASKNETDEKTTDQKAPSCHGKKAISFPSIKYVTNTRGVNKNGGL